MAVKLDTILILGTSHISKESIKEITLAMERFSPSIVAVELDRHRLESLLHPSRKPTVSFALLRRVGVKGFVFAIIGSYVQEKLGRVVGVKPGEDMKTAVLLAKQHHRSIALIDQDLDVTLARFSAALSWKEKGRFLGDLFRAFFFRKREMKRWGLSELDLSRVPPKQVILNLLGGLRKRYPNVYRVLIHERNVVMAARLASLADKQPNAKILAVVGAGHEEDLARMLRHILPSTKK